MVGLGGDRGIGGALDAPDVGNSDPERSHSIDGPARTEVTAEARLDRPALSLEFGSAAGRDVDQRALALDR